MTILFQAVKWKNMNLMTWNMILHLCTNYHVQYQVSQLEVLDAIIIVRTSVMETQVVCQNVWRDAPTQDCKDIRTSVAASGGGITASVYQSVWKDVTILGCKDVRDT